VPERVALAAWAIAWCLRHPAVSSVVAGSKSVQQLQAMRSGRPGPGAGGVALGGQPIYRLDTDAIRDLRPDLVLSQDLCAVCAVPSGHVNQALDVLGCQAEVISLDPSSLDEVLDGVLRVGKAAGVEQRAREVVAGLRERLASVQAAVEGLERPRVFALDWGDPPFNGGHWVPEMLQVAGAKAVLASPAAPSVRVTWAQIEAAAPQVVVFMPCGYSLQATVEEPGRTLLERAELAGAEAIVAVNASAYWQCDDGVAPARLIPRLVCVLGGPAVGAAFSAIRCRPACDPAWLVSNGRSWTDHGDILNELGS